MNMKHLIAPEIKEVFKKEKKARCKYEGYRGRPERVPNGQSGKKLSNNKINNSIQLLLKE